jgi:hypothetical protein
VPPPRWPSPVRRARTVPAQSAPICNLLPSHPGNAAFSGDSLGDVRSLPHITPRPTGRPLIVAGVRVGAAIVGLGAASAQEYCVTCTQPNAVYRCVIEDARPGGQSLTRLCLTALTREGGHGACSLKGGTVFDCNGPIKRVPWTAQDSGRVAEPAAEPQANQPAPGAKADAKGEPKTMLDLAKRANENLQKANEDAKDQAQSAGEAIGKATKKTWDCMLSLFSRC